MPRAKGGDPLRCTVVTPYGTLGGSERWLLQLLDSTERLEADVVTLAQGELVESLKARGVPVRVLPTGSGVLSLLRSLIRVYVHIRRSQPEVVLANGVKAGVVAGFAGRLAGTPVVWAKHDFSFDRTLARVVASVCNLVVANSEAVAERLGDRERLVIPPPKPHGVATREEARRFWQTQRLPSWAGLTLATVSRLHPYKGIDTAIEALAEPGLESWRLVVVGGEDPATPGEGQRLRKLAGQLGVDQRVCLLGDVSEAGRWLSAFDAVAVVTRTDERGFGREGYSMVALEALAAGVPLVGAEDSPEVNRMAESAGVVVPPANPKRVAAALRQLSDPVERLRRGSSGLSLVANHPNSRDCASRVVSAMAGLVGRPGAGLSGGPPLTVLTCMRNEQGNVDGVLAAVLAQLGDGDEYLVVDDQSTDGTPAEIARWAKRDHRVRVLPGPGVNLSAARNAGFAAALHEIVACTDAGCIPEPGWLEALRAPFAEPDAPDLVVGVYHVPAEGFLQEAISLSAFPCPEESRRASVLRQTYERLLGRGFSATRLDGRSMAVTRRAWMAVGGFEEGLYSSEDAVFGHAVLQAGFRSVLATEADVAWQQDPSIRSMSRMYFRYGKWGAVAEDRSLIMRDVVRVGAYGMAPVVALKGGQAVRAGGVLAALVYLSLPYARAWQRRRPLRVYAAIPIALAVKDISKGMGCAVGLCHVLLGRRRQGHP